MRSGRGGGSSGRSGGPPRGRKPHPQPSYAGKNQHPAATSGGAVIASAANTGVSATNATVTTAVPATSTAAVNGHSAPANNNQPISPDSHTSPNQTTAHAPVPSSEAGIFAGQPGKGSSVIIDPCHEEKKFRLWVGRGEFRFENY